MKKQIFERLILGIKKCVCRTEIRMMKTVMCNLLSFRRVSLLHTHNFFSKAWWNERPFQGIISYFLPWDPMTEIYFLVSMCFWLSTSFLLQREKCLMVVMRLSDLPYFFVSSLKVQIKIFINDQLRLKCN